MREIVTADDVEAAVSAAMVRTAPPDVRGYHPAARRERWCWYSEPV